MNEFLTITKKDRQVINIVWISSKDALNLIYAIKLQENIVFLFAIGMITTLMPNS